MIKIKMKDSLLVVPNTWEQRVPCNENLHTHAYVIEFLHGDEYSLPHFFFTTQEAELNDSLKKQYLEYACTKSDAYFKVRQKYPDHLPSDILGPKPGFFEIPKLGTTDNYPFGAMVIDTEAIEEGGD